jgi:Glycosyltransferase family 87
MGKILVRFCGPSPYRLPVYLACTVLALLVNYFLGKDMSWDMLNYHFYAGFSALNNRFAQDYFAAGPQSYFNPYAYVPFYGLVRSGLSSLAISSLLAVVHSVTLWLTFELAILVCPSNDDRNRLTMALCAVALALANPILIQQLGSSFADITTAELVLGGWVLLVSAVKRPRISAMIFAALLLGAATALKLTNSVHVIASFAVVVWLPLPLPARGRHIILYSAFLGVGFGIVAAPWSFHLAEMFGNPFFPMLNNIFHSPEFTSEPLRQFRFIPANFAQALWRPFAMVNPVRMVHEELSAPDPRYAVLLVLSCALLARWLRNRLESVVPRSAKPDVGPRILGALGCGFAVDWILWLSASGNSRYFLPMASVAAVLLTAVLFRLLASRLRVRNYILAAIFLSQSVQLLMGAEFRWTGVPWNGQWFNTSMSEKLATQPNLFLTIGMQSNSFLAPFLAPNSGLVNFSGSYTPLAMDGASGERVEALIDRYKPRVRMLVRGEKLYSDAEQRLPRLSHIDDALARFGLRVDTTDCATITVRGLPPDLELGFKGAKPNQATPLDVTYLVSCHVIDAPVARTTIIARQQTVDLVLNRLEDACPELLQPSRTGTEQDGAIWRRRYANTDLSATVSNGRVHIRDPLRADALIYAGRESDWVQGTQRLECGRTADGYVARLSKP